MNSDREESQDKLEESQCELELEDENPLLTIKLKNGDTVQVALDDFHDFMEKNRDQVAPRQREGGKPRHPQRRRFTEDSVDVGQEKEECLDEVRLDLISDEAIAAASRYWEYVDSVEKE